jgi:hypothetical protein
MRVRKGYIFLGCLRHLRACTSKPSPLCFYGHALARFRAVKKARLRVTFSLKNEKKFEQWNYRTTIFCPPAGGACKRECGEAFAPEFARARSQGSDNTLSRSCSHRRARILDLGTPVLAQAAPRPCARAGTLLCPTSTPLRSGNALSCSCSRGKALVLILGTLVLAQRPPLLLAFP